MKIRLCGENMLTSYNIKSDRERNENEVSLFVKYKCNCNCSVECVNLNTNILTHCSYFLCVHFISLSELEMKRNLLS